MLLEINLQILKVSRGVFASLETIRHLFELPIFKVASEYTELKNKLKGNPHTYLHCE